MTFLKPQLFPPSSQKKSFFSSEHSGVGLPGTGLTEVPSLASGPLAVSPGTVRFATAFSESHELCAPLRLPSSFSHQANDNHTRGPEAREGPGSAAAAASPHLQPRSLGLSLRGGRRPEGREPHRLPFSWESGRGHAGSERRRRSSSAGTRAFRGEARWCLQDPTSAGGPR